MEQIAANVYVETGYEGVNVGAIDTPHGIIAIDVPSYPRDAREWATRLHRLNKNPLQYLILTDFSGDRILNARWLTAPIITHQVTADRLIGYDKRFPQSLIESLTTRNAEKGRDLTSGPVEKPALSFSQDLTIQHNGTHVQLISAPGPNSSSSWVYLPDSGILFMSDTLVVDRHPLLTEAISGAWLTTLEKVTQQDNRWQQLVPGRGPLCTVDAVEPIQHYLQLLQERVGQLIANEQPKEDVNNLIPEFLSMFPIHNLPAEWVKRQIKSSLALMYDELQLEESKTS